VYRGRGRVGYMGEREGGEEEEKKGMVSDVDAMAWFARFESIIAGSGGSE